MKWVLAALFILGAALVAFGPPGARPERTHSFDQARAVLPMTFAHADHVAEPCATCHHEFVDGISGLTCISCHLTDPTVSPLLETQFHMLCRSCHVEARAAGQAHGPTRHCIACHLPDREF